MKPETVSLYKFDLKHKKTAGSGRFFVIRFLLSYYCSVKKRIFEPHIFYGEFLVIQIIKRAGIGFKIKNQFI